jgi:hypothetical protein
MRYSRYQHNLHVEKVATILRDDPMLSARAVFRILNDKGMHFSRSYVNSVVADANLRLADEERRARTGMYQIGDWLLKVMNLSAEMEEIRKKLDSAFMEYPHDIGPRY